MTAMVTAMVTAMGKYELTTVPLKKGAFEKPERTNPNIPSKKYDRVEAACESAEIGNDGNAYIPEDSMPGVIGKRKNETRYIVDHRIKDEDKVNINNRRMLNTAGVVDYLHRNSQQTRNVEEADLNRYGRDILKSISDSDQAEAQRRKTDAFVNRELPKLREKRGTDVDEITGEPLGPGAAFHHINNKAINNNPLDVIDPDQGINVNVETHREIHSRGIMDSAELDRQKEDIRETLRDKNRRNNRLQAALDKKR